MHTHSRAGGAVSALASGLLPISQHALRFYGKVGYHDYEGATLIRVNANVCSKTWAAMTC